MNTPEFEIRNDDSDSFHRGKVKVTVWTDWEDAQKLVQLAFELYDHQREEADAKRQAEFEDLFGIMKPGVTIAQSIFDDPHVYAQNTNI